MVVPMAHNTQQNFLIHSFDKSDGFHGQDIFYDISTNIQLLLIKFQPHILLTHIHTQQASHFCCMYLWAYATKATAQLG